MKFVYAVWCERTDAGTKIPPSLVALFTKEKVAENEAEIANKWRGSRYTRYYVEKIVVQ